MAGKIPVTDMDRETFHHENDPPPLGTARLVRLAETSSLTTRGSRSVEQWVDKVLAFSSEYSPSAWSAQQLVGPATVYPDYGDHDNAWTHSSCGSPSEFLELEYAESVYITEVAIYETCLPGAVVRVAARPDQGEWVTLWSSPEPHIMDIESSRIFQPPIKHTTFKSKAIRLELNCSPSDDFCEIDAVKLIGYKDLHVPEAPPPLSSLSEDFSHLVNNKFMSDVTFDIQGHMIYGHRAIMAARSTYFRDLFSGEDASLKVCKLDGIPKEVFLGVQQYLYTHTLDDAVTPLMLVTLTRVSCRFCLDGLKNLCLFLLQSEITPQNVVEVFMEADKTQPVINDVKKMCLEFMKQHMPTVTQTQAFCNLPQSVMLEIIQKATSQVTA